MQMHDRPNAATVHDSCFVCCVIPVGFGSASKSLTSARELMDICLPFKIT